MHRLASRGAINRLFACISSSPLTDLGHVQPPLLVLTVFIGLMLLSNEGFAQTCSGQIQLSVISSDPTTFTVTVNGLDPSQPTQTPFDWAWGDGTFSSGWFPQTHTYANAGPFPLFLIANEDDGSTDCAELQISFLPTLVLLFRGGISDTGGLDWSDLESLINLTLSGNVVTTQIGPGTRASQENDALTWISLQQNQYGPTPVVLIGHSFGGDTVTYTTIPNSLVVAIDPIDRDLAEVGQFDQSTVIVASPSQNVINYYQTNGGYQCFPQEPFKGFQTLNGANSDESTITLPDGSILFTDHCGIEHVATIQDLIINNIAAVATSTTQLRVVGRQLVGFNHESSGAAKGNVRGNYLGRRQELQR
jgi:hypothetical protein